jgi:hypothetical protein
VIAKVEYHRGELFPRVGFIVTTLTPPNPGHLVPDEPAAAALQDRRTLDPA